MRKPLFRQFGFRVTVAIVAAILAVVLLNVVLIYRFTAQAQFENLRNRLKVIAQTAAQIVDSDKIAHIPLNQEGINTQEYAYTNEQLKKIKAANPRIKYIYILSKIDNTDIWRFVVDVDSQGQREKKSLPGAAYDAGRFAQLLNGLNEPSADKKIEIDEWGKTVSGYAPIRDAAGKPIAVLGVDILADDVYIMMQQVRQRALVILIIGVFLAFLIGVAISHRVVGPIQQLITGTTYIAGGHLHHQVHIGGDDEISELAEAFNRMAKNLQESRGKLLNYFYDTVTSMVTVLEIRDHYTLGHSESVANYAEKIARRMGFDTKSVDMFKRVALLHDIGKVGVRDNVLLKPDKLNDEEWNAIKLHPILGEQILRPILEDALMLSVIRNHHERYDGGGYPDSLKGDQIPLLVAIVTVADCYDAMTSTRAYRKAMSKEFAIDQLMKNRGSQFHPDVVDVFVKILNEEEQTRHT